MSHEEHKHIIISVSCGQCDPDFSIRSHSSDYVYLLAEDFVWCSIAHPSSFPASLVEVCLRYPALIDIDDALLGLVHLEHLLSVETTKDPVALAVTLERHSFNLAPGEL